MKGTKSFSLWYPSGASPSLIGYSNSDYEGCKLSGKVQVEGVIYLVVHLSRHSKKQACVALSTTEAEYIAAGSCCVQILCMKHKLEDYNIFLDHIPLKCDSTSAINFTTNPIMYSRTKHIEVRHHFIKDHIIKRDYIIEFIDTNHQLANIFTKPFYQGKGIIISEWHWVS